MKCLQVLHVAIKILKFYDQGGHWGDNFYYPTRTKCVGSSTCKYSPTTPYYAASVPIINPRCACAARVTVLGLSVSVCVFLSVYLYSQITGNKAARERYTCLQHNKPSKNNLADIAQRTH